MQVGLPTSKVRLLQDSLFPPWEHSIQSSDPNDEDLVKLQQEDPLATKIWRMYSRTKTQLAGQERVENLTWRMMSMTLQREREQRENARLKEQQNQQQRQLPKSSVSQSNAPKSSGIAQLRQSLEEAVVTQPSLNSMDLDDFIVPSSMGPPSGQQATSSTLENEHHHQHQLQGQKQQQHGHELRTANGIPIKSRKHLQHSSVSGFAPASVPNHRQDFQRSDEFGYVQRRVRKTSIDERL
ncbi:hypothetical protein KEM54_001504, partial [Ascosphaera aggregata]